MKCLLCGISAYKDFLLKHYVDYHRVDPQNYFFKYLFLTDNYSICSCCCRCNEFITTKKHQRQHNFLEHYQEGNKIPIKEKPIEIKRTQLLTTYEISFDKHSNYYDFSDPEQVINHFLINVQQRFKSIGQDVSIKCGFSIENIQPPPTAYTVAMVNSRYWTTDVYRTIYLNDNILSRLSEDISKRVIVNGLSGSSWHFSKFLYINLNVLRDNDIFTQRRSDNDDVEMTNNNDNDIFFIDDAPIEKQGPSFYGFVNQKLDPKKVLEECVREESELMEEMEGSNYNFWGDEFEKKIDEFEGSKKGIKKIEETLVNPVGKQDRENALFYALIYSIRYQRK